MSRVMAQATTNPSGPKGKRPSDKLSDLTALSMGNKPGHVYLDALRHAERLVSKALDEGGVFMWEGDHPLDIAHKIQRATVQRVAERSAQDPNVRQARTKFDTVVAAIEDDQPVYDYTVSLAMSAYILGLAMGFETRQRAIRGVA